MKKFIVRLIIALGLAAAVTALFYLILLVTHTNLNINFLGDEVLYVTRKAEVNSGCSKVIIGDSVANQLWPQETSGDDICYMTSNQAITAAGDYLLLYHYLESNPQTKEVYLALRPQSLSNDINIDKSFQYFVIPFANSGNAKLLDTDTRTKLDSRFGKFWINSKYAQWTLLNNNFLLSEYLKTVEKKNPDLVINDDDSTNRYYHRISPTGQIYLEKIIELCDSKNIKLSVVPSPLMDTADNYGWEGYSEDIEAFGFDEVLGSYLDSVDYYPEEMFMDGIHFSESALKENREAIANKIIPVN